MKQEFFYPSKDKVTQIHAIRWVPEETPRAILQICHGMQEYIDRYDDFACFLMERGIYVVGNDHLGHILPADGALVGAVIVAQPGLAVLLRHEKHLVRVGQRALVLDFFDALRRKGLQQLAGLLAGQVQALPGSVIQIFVGFGGFLRDAPRAVCMTPS